MLVDKVRGSLQFTCGNWKSCKHKEIKISKAHNCLLIKSMVPTKMEKKKKSRLSSLLWSPHRHGSTLWPFMINEFLAFYDPSLCLFFASALLSPYQEYHKYMLNIWRKFMKPNKSYSILKLHFSETTVHWILTFSSNSHQIPLKVLIAKNISWANMTLNY